MPEQKTATFIRQKNGRGEGRIYKLDPPMPTEDGGTTEYVWVSAVVAYSGPETYIFASDSEGAVDSYLELPGSFQGGLDHEAALNSAGYTII